MVVKVVDYLDYDLFYVYVVEYYWDYYQFGVKGGEVEVDLQKYWGYKWQYVVVDVFGEVVVEVERESVVVKQVKVKQCLGVVVGVLQVEQQGVEVDGYQFCQSGRGNVEFFLVVECQGQGCYFGGQQQKVGEIEVLGLYGVVGYQIEGGDCVNDFYWDVDEEDLVSGGVFYQYFVQCWVEQWVDLVWQGDEGYCCYILIVWDDFYYCQVVDWYYYCVVDFLQYLCYYQLVEGVGLGVKQ